MFEAYRLRTSGCVGVSIPLIGPLKTCQFNREARENLGGIKKDLYTYGHIELFIFQLGWVIKKAASNNRISASSIQQKGAK